MIKSKKNILASVLTVALCLSLVAGATYAMFASEHSTDIAVASGKVAVSASISELHMYTRNEHGGRVDGEWLSGQAYEQDGTITLSNMAPYDGVTFDIAVVSSSTVAIKWQVKLTFDGDSDLYGALDVDLGNIDLVDTGTERVSNWATLAPSESEQTITTLSVNIKLREDAGKAAQGKNCSITVTVYAVQGNATTTDPVA